MNLQNFNDKRIELIDYLKGIAIIMIIMVHYAQSFLLPNEMNKIFIWLERGCQVFFLISALTICISYTHKKPKYFAFIKHRFSTLISGWYLAILVHIVVDICLNEVFSKSTLHSSNLFEILMNLFFLNGLFYDPINNLVVRGGWFVGTIVIFYMFFPILYKVYTINNIVWKKCRYFIFPLAMLITSLITVYLWNINSIKINNSFLIHLPCFTLGFSLWDITMGNNKKFISFSIFKAIVTFGLALVLYYSKMVFLLPLDTFMFTLSTYYIFFFLYNKNPIKEYNEIIAKFGKVNYGIYLIHGFVVWELTQCLKLLIHNLIPCLSEIFIFIFLCPIIVASSYLSGKVFLKFAQCITENLNFNNLK